MNLSEALEARLLAYVDDQLDETEIAEIETLLKHNPEATAFVRLLKAGDVPYAEAFAHELIEPLPDTIVEYVQTVSDNREK